MFAPDASIYKLCTLWCLIGDCHLLWYSRVSVLQGSCKGELVLLRTESHEASAGKNVQVRTTMCQVCTTMCQVRTTVSGMHDQLSGMHDYMLGTHDHVSDMHDQVSVIHNHVLGTHHHVSS